VWARAPDGTRSLELVHAHIPYSLLRRAGPKAIAKNAAVGAVLLALIEGVGIAINKAVMRAQMDQMAGGTRVDTLEPPVPPGFGTRDLTDLLVSGAGGASLQLR
jgi:hypothetical protein